MLVRILTDNPGETFTRNLDERFVDTIRALLKNVKDRSVWQLLMETLDDFEYTRMNDQNLAPLVLMWKKEKEAAIKKHGVGLISSMLPSLIPPGHQASRTDHHLTGQGATATDSA